MTISNELLDSLGFKSLSVSQNSRSIRLSNRMSVEVEPDSGRIYAWIHKSGFAEETVKSTGLSIQGVSNTPVRLTKAFTGKNSYVIFKLTSEDLLEVLLQSLSSLCEVKEEEETVVEENNETDMVSPPEDPTDDDERLHDSIYLWKTGILVEIAGEIKYVVKYGKTSSHLGNERITDVAKTWGFVYYTKTILRSPTKVGAVASAQFEATMKNRFTSCGFQKGKVNKLDMDGKSEMVLLSSSEVEEAITLFDSYVSK